jgi:hypothetical protein
MQTHLVCHNTPGLYQTQYSLYIAVDDVPTTVTQIYEVAPPPSVLQIFDEVGASLSVNIVILL